MAKAKAVVLQARGRLAKAEAAMPWAEAEAGSTIARGLMAWRQPQARNGLPLGPAIQAQGDKVVQKREGPVCPRPPALNKRIFRECTVVVVG